MRILFTNDDGVNASGINILASEFAVDNEVFIAAPSTNCSAFSHSLSLHKELFYSQTQLQNGITCYSIDGTPADCVKFALLHLMQDNPPDIVISGINNGPNLGSDIMYSGTVAAAFEAAYLGVKAIAVSLSYWEKDDSHYREAAQFIKRNLHSFIKLNLPNDIVLNINYPAHTSYKGAVFTRAGINLYSDIFKEITSTGGFKLEGRPIAHTFNVLDCDVEWSEKGYATITPLTLDRTDYQILQLLKNEGTIK